MIDKKILFSLVALALFVGCDAGEKIQDAVDDTKDFISNEKNMVSDGGEGNITHEIKDLLTVHNEARMAVGVDANLKWSDTIAQDAQLYADRMASEGIWGHDTAKNQHDGYGHGDYGENLYTSSNKISFKEAAVAWVDEKKDYLYGVIGDKSTCAEGKMCGHYTQVVWKDTTLVGCAYSKYKVDLMINGNNAKGWNIVVCKYQTPGNIIGQRPY